MQNKKLVEIISTEKFIKEFIQNLRTKKVCVKQIEKSQNLKCQSDLNNL